VTPRLLDAFCGAGGAGVGYHRAGFDVVGVDIKPQPRYPFEFHQGDALEFIREHGREFDAIHASPPCQSYLNLTRLNESLGRAHDHPDLIDGTRAALTATGRVYAIENVVGAPLVTPIRLCGTSFGLPLRRHRLFESNVGMLGMPCAHSRFTEPKFFTSDRPAGQKRFSTVVQVYGVVRPGRVQEWPAAMGIDWMTHEELRLAIPPVFTEFIGRQLMTALAAEAAS
jgi:DNA (cytosine-5)-methyltransferase 1